MNNDDLVHRPQETLIPVTLPDPLTKREAFAMAAMQGILASDWQHQVHQNDCAVMALGFADATLKALEESDGE